MFKLKTQLISMLLLLSLQVSMISCTKTEGVDYASVRELVKGNVLADFIAEHTYTVIAVTNNSCGACKGLDAIFNDVGENRKDVVMAIANLDIIGKRPAAVKEYKITCYPTLIFFKNGKEVSRLEGSLPADMLLSKVNSAFKKTKKVKKS